MALSQQDRDILRALIEEQAEIAALPIQRERAELWRRLNRLEAVRPLVWMNEVPWNEMNVNDELTCRASDRWARSVEWGLRALLYQWRHFPGDMVVSDYLSSPIVHFSTGVGIHEHVAIARTDPTSSVVSRKFHRQIVNPSDVEKIQMPTVVVDERATAEHYERLCEVAGDILPVRQEGRKNLWFAPWDELIRWWGVEEGLRDLVDRPEMVHEAMTRLVDAHLHELDQLEALHLLTLNNDNTRIGSGGYGYTDELPGDDSTRTTSAPKTCGVARRRRSSPKSPRRCTGSLPSNTRCAGSSAGGSPIMAVANRSIKKWRFFAACRICESSR